MKENKNSYQKTRIKSVDVRTRINNILWNFYTIKLFSKEKKNIKG